MTGTQASSIQLVEIVSDRCRAYDQAVRALMVANSTYPESGSENWRLDTRSKRALSTGGAANEQQQRFDLHYESFRSVFSVS